MRKFVAKDVYQLPLAPKNGVNAFLIEDTLVDAGIKSSAKTILKYTSGIKINQHVLTHSHLDHMGSSNELSKTLKMPIWCGTKEKKYAENGRAILGVKFKKNPFANIILKAAVNPPVKISSTLNEGDIVSGFTVIDTPGHTPGHISLFRDDDGVMILGDVLLNLNLLTTKKGLHLPPLFSTVNQKQNLRSLKKVLDLKPSIICFGHGPVLTDFKILQSFAKKYERYF